VELLWVSIRGDHEDHCLDVSQWTGLPSESTNIMPICLSTTECELQRNWLYRKQRLYW
jgi:hypothetical protein